MLVVSLCCLTGCGARYSRQALPAGPAASPSPSAAPTPSPEKTADPVPETVEPTQVIPTETSTVQMSSAVYRTTDVLNVRAEPRTDSRRLGQLISGATVEYIRAENEEWAVILFNGQEAYVASQYLTTQ